MSQQQVVVSGPSTLAAAQQVAREPSTMDLMQQIISMPGSEGLDKVAMLERLVALKERTDEQSRKEQFSAALSRLQAKLPQIDKRGKIEVQGQVRSRYARVEDIDVQVRPYLSEEGFSFSWDTESAPAPGEVRYVGTLTHCAGHAEKKHIDMPIEDEMSSTGKLLMTKVQKRGSTLSFAIRTLLRMHLNLVMRDEDNGGQGNVDLVSAKDLSVIKTMISDTETDLPRFLKYMGVETLEDIARRDVQRALVSLKAKAGKKAAE